MRTMRVLHVIDSLQLGGAEQLVLTLAKHIRRQEYDLRVCSLHGIDEQSPVVQGLRALGVRLLVLEGFRRHDPLHITRLAALVHREGVDVVHTHLPYATTVGILAARLARVRVIATLHSSRDTWAVRGSVKRAINALVLRWGADTVVGVSAVVGASAIARLGIPAGKLRVVPNAIDVRSFMRLNLADVRQCRDELLGAFRGPLIVSVGSLRPAKGHAYLVEATPRVLERFPHARVVIVGGSGPSEPVVRERIVGLGLHERVLLTGPRGDIPTVLAAGDVVVQPSLWEGLPLVVLEAMAAATPVVATTACGVHGLVGGRVGGRLVPASDADALAMALCDLLADPETARQLGLAGQARVVAEHSADTWARRYEAMYRELAA